MSLLFQGCLFILSWQRPRASPFPSPIKKTHHLVVAKYSVWAHFPYGSPPLTGTPWGRGVHVLAPFPSPPLIYLLHVRGCRSLYYSLAFCARSNSFPSSFPLQDFPKQVTCGRNWKTRSDGWLEKGTEGRACCLFYPFPQLSVDLLGDYCS